MITIYDNAGTALGTLSNSAPNAVPYSNDHYRENLLTGENEFYFECPLGVMEDGVIDGLNLVSIQDEDNTTLLFSIIDLYEDRDGETPTLQVTCESLIISELNDLYFGAVNAVTLEEALNQTFGKTDYVVEMPFNVTVPNQVFKVEGFITGLDMIRQIGEFYSVEYLLRAETNGFSITGRKLSIVRARGNEYRGKYFMYERDLLGLTRSVDFTRLKNAIVPVGKPYPNGTQRNLIGYTPTNPVAGFPKPLDTSYVLNLEAYETYTQRSQIKSGLIYLPEEESLEALYQAAVAKAKEVGSPEYKYEVDVLLLENALDIEGEVVRLGDQVWFKDVSGNSTLGLTARVIELTRSKTNPQLDKALFSNFAEIDATGNVNLDELKRQVAQAQASANTAQAEASAAQAQAEVAKAEAEAAKIIANQAKETASSKNRIWSGVPTPDSTLVTEGDTWFRPNTPPMLDDILQYQGGKWVVTYNAKEVAQIGNIANSASQAAGDAGNKADQAIVGANKAIADAGFAQVTADGAKQGVVQVEQTLIGLQTTVASKAEQSQVTQLANQLTSTVTLVNGHTSQISQLGTDINLRVTQSQVDASILADNTLKDTRDTNQKPGWYYTEYPRQTVRELKRRTVIGITVGTALVGALETVIQWKDASVGGITQTFRSTDGVFQRKSVSTTAWSAWGQIADSTNIVSQINISPESILIQSKRIHLAGDTTIDNAVIKSAMIDSMTASKLTAGTIDASIINVKNINADDINAGTLRGREVINTFDSMFQGARLVGETSLKDSQISIDWTSVTYPEQSGYFNINPLSIGGGYKENNVTKAWWELTTKALTLSNEGKTAILSAERLYDSGWIDVPRNTSNVYRNWSNPTTDYGGDFWNTRVRKRLGSVYLSFFMRAGAVRGPGNTPITSAIEIGTIPSGFRPEIGFTTIAGTNTLTGTGTIRTDSNGVMYIYASTVAGTGSISFSAVYADNSI